MTFTISAGWRAGIELECDDRRGQQVYCLTHDPGLEWIDAFNDLPAGAIEIQPLPYLRRTGGRAGGRSTAAPLHSRLPRRH
jgi:hypothetical protein